MISNVQRLKTKTSFVFQPKVISKVPEVVLLHYFATSERDYEFYIVWCTHITGISFLIVTLILFEIVYDMKQWSSSSYSRGLTAETLTTSELLGSLRYSSVNLR